MHKFLVRRFARWDGPSGIEEWLNKVASECKGTFGVKVATNDGWLVILIGNNGETFKNCHENT